MPSVQVFRVQAAMYDANQIDMNKKEAHHRQSGARHALVD